ncbi:hypothetical protein T492DRAFT_134733 [Pavlovales sp. CCMP2436]|nr:hypothetical protein T492DRAFT_134733 [Pavlovales sp. CCMP2436]
MSAQARALLRVRGARGCAALVLLLCACELNSNLRGSLLSASTVRLPARAAFTPPPELPPPATGGEPQLESTGAPRTDRPLRIPRADGPLRSPAESASSDPRTNEWRAAAGEAEPSELCPQHRWVRNDGGPAGRMPPSTAHASVFRGGDLEAPCELERALAARSRHGELVFTIATEQASSYAVNLIWGLRRVGIGHSLVVVLDAEHCGLLASPPWDASCAHTSFRLIGLVGTVLQPYRLEWSKLHYIRRMVALRVSPLFLDADVAVVSNPYPLLRAPALRSQNAIFAARAATGNCGRVLLGLVYCNRCKPGGPAERMFARAFARHERYWAANDSIVQAHWAVHDALGLSSGPHKHLSIHRSNELMGDIALSACCAAAAANAVAPASRVLVGARERFFKVPVHNIPGCALLQREHRQAKGVHVHEIRHWHEATLSASEREAALRLLAADTKSADGQRFKAVSDIQNFIEFSTQLALGQFPGEPPGLADEDAPDATGRVHGPGTSAEVRAAKALEVETVRAAIYTYKLRDAYIHTACREQ